MPPKGFKCKRCGHCCLDLHNAYETQAAPEDVARWQRESRHDVLAFVDAIPSWEQAAVYDIWINPEDGDEVNRCPWLFTESDDGVYSCLIHKTKPRQCRDFPRSREHAKKTGCRGFVAHEADTGRAPGPGRAIVANALDRLKVSKQPGDLGEPSE